jgi:hypothetical protein
MFIPADYSLWPAARGKAPQVPGLHLGLLPFRSWICHGARVGREGMETPARFLDFVPVSTFGAGL